MRWIIFLAILVFISGGVSANFVCGEVEDSNRHSASWLNIISYYEESPEDMTSCKTNPYNKFCCDLDEIPSVNPSPGKKVFAEVFDKQTGLVAGPVDVTLSAEGYDLFENMRVQEAINVKVPKKVLINSSLISLNISASPTFPNLRYVLNNSQGSFSNIMCTNCTSFKLAINLSKGKNFLEVFAYDSRNFEISKILTLHSLEYLSINQEFICGECEQRGSEYIIPPETEVKVKITVDSSHPLSGELKNYVDFSWEKLSPEIIEFSSAYNVFQTSIKGANTVIEYETKTPQGFLPKIYESRIEFEEHSGDKPHKVRVSNSLRWPSFLYRKVNFNKKESFKESEKGNIIYPEYPLIVYAKDSLLEHMAIYPTKKSENIYARLVTEKKGLFATRENKFFLQTNLQQNEISKIRVKLRAPKEKSLEVFQGENKLQVTSTGPEDKNFDYVWVSPLTKEAFSVKVN